MAEEKTEEKKEKAERKEEDNATITIQRYDSAQGSYAQTHHLRLSSDMVVLDALNELKDNADGTLSYRWSCRMGICGSCGAMVNGKPVLTCETFLKDCGKNIVVAPLRNFPLIKDLVVDIDEPLNKMRTVMPYVAFAAKKSLERETALTPKEMEGFQQASQCIKCMLCYSACPVYGRDRSFLGPAALALAYRYQKDPRDKGKEARLDIVTEKEGVWKCSFVGECSTACPKRVDPALAIQRLKVMGALHAAKKLVGGGT